MSRGGRIGMLIGGVIIAVAAVVVLYLGFVGVSKTAAAGTQTSVCGSKIGVTVSSEPGREQTVRLLGASSERLSAGDRVRLSPVCVVEIVKIGETAGSGDETGTDTDTDTDSDTDIDQDGGTVDVQLRWRLW